MLALFLFCMLILDDCWINVLLLIVLTSGPKGKHGHARVVFSPPNEECWFISYYHWLVSVHNQHAFLACPRQPVNYWQPYLNNRTRTYVRLYLHVFAHTCAHVHVHVRTPHTITLAFMHMYLSPPHTHRPCRRPLMGTSVYGLFCQLGYLSFPLKTLWAR